MFKNVFKQKIYPPTLCLFYTCILIFQSCGNKYDSQGEFIGGYASIEIKGKFGFISQDGKEVIAPKYEEVSNFIEHLAKVKLNGKYGFVNTEGKEVVAPKYDKVYGFNRDLAKTEIGGKFGYISKEGKELIPAKYDAVNYNIIGGYFEVAENGIVNRIERKSVDK